MKRTIVFTSLIAFFASTFALGFHDGISVMPSVQAQENEEYDRNQFRCTANQLRGNYGVLADGFFTEPTFLPLPIGQLDAGPFAAVGRLTIKRDRTFSLTLTQSFNGKIVPKLSFPGTFTLNPADCTGSLNLEIKSGAAIFNVPFEFVVVNEGREIQFMRTTRGAVITGVAKSQDDD